MTTVNEALQQSLAAAPQTSIPLVRGVNVRRTRGGIPVVRLHYSAHPDRDPERNPEWKKAERSTYTSEAAWQREQEIVDEAGGGELVFADALVTYWNKIVIRDPHWRPDPDWSVYGGFDHGKTNPTAMERAYVDFDGNIYLAGEYYVPGKSVWEHVPELKQMPDVEKLTCCMADPSVFDQKTQQEKGKEARAISDVYMEEGVDFLTRFGGNRNDQTFAERVLQHWSALDENEPTLFIVCRNYGETPQPGLHPWDCPNLLWEMMRTRRRKLTAQQLLTQNQSEEIIDKDNHARDCLKYIVMTLPEPTRKTAQRRRAEMLRTFKDDPMNTALRMMKLEAEIKKEQRPMIFGGSARRAMAQLQRNRRSY